MQESFKKATVDRREKILNLISEKGKVYVHELSEACKVSKVTIRNDLDQLEKRNQLMRVRGGALKIENRVSMDYNLSKKYKLNHKEKAVIGKKATTLINDSDTIILDAGTTTAEVARNLLNIKNLSVITNAVNIVNILAQFEDIDVIIPGGHLRKNSLSLVGALGENNIRGLYADKAFLGANGFESKIGAFTQNIEECQLNKLMIEMANEVIFVVDSSKFNRKSLALICPVSSINTIVTDEGLSHSDRKELEESGVKVIIA